MIEKPRHVPDGYGTLTPYIIVEGAARAIAFYEHAFAARQVMHLDGPNERIGHAELEIGESKFMLADQFPDFGAHAPGHYGGSPVSLHLYVADADATVARSGSWRDDRPRGRRSVLRRPSRHDQRSVRAPLARCDAQGDAHHRRTPPTCRRARTTVASRVKLTRADGVLWR